MEKKCIIKVGGSICNPAILKKLGEIFKEMYGRYKFAIIPGGGRFADLVRKVDREFKLSPINSDKMAILAMDQYGLLLSDVMKLPTTDKLKELKNLENAKQPPIFLPSKHFFRESPLPHSWEVTSDSIAAYLASKINADRVILVKDVDGIFTSDPKKSTQAKLIKKITAKELIALRKRTCVDSFLPKLLLKHKLSCYIVNGQHPKRIKDLLKKRKTVCTEILP